MGLVWGHGQSMMMKPDEADELAFAYSICLKTEKDAQKGVAMLVNLGICERMLGTGMCTYMHAQ